MREPLLDINDFNKPKEVNDNMAIILMIVRLVLTNPGTSMFQPEMGIGLHTVWRYVTENNLDDLNTAISDQMAEYLPKEAQSITVEAQMHKNESDSIDRILILSARIDDDIYNIKIDKNGKYEISFTKISDLK